MVTYWIAASFTLYPPLPSLLVSYGGMHTQTWIRHPSSLLVCSDDASIISSMFPSQVRGYSDARAEAPSRWVKPVPSGSQRREPRRGAPLTIAAAATSILPRCHRCPRRTLSQRAELRNRQSSRNLPRRRRLMGTCSTGSLKTKGRNPPWDKRAAPSLSFSKYQPTTLTRWFLLYTVNLSLPD